MKNNLIYKLLRINKLNAILLSVLFLIISINATKAQREEFRHIYEHAINFPDDLEFDTPEIVEHLVQATSNNKETVFAFYYFLANYIMYDLDKFISGDMTYTSIFETLESRKTMCQGFSELFCDFCEWIDIPCEIIRGYVKGYGYSNEVFEQTNHLWNAVFIDDEWHLVDITWASGIITRSGFGRRRYQVLLREQFVFADPEFLILTHFPLDPKWQLLENPITLEEYYSREHNQRRLQSLTEQ